MHIHEQPHIFFKPLPKMGRPTKMESKTLEFEGIKNHISKNVENPHELHAERAHG